MKILVTSGTGEGKTSLSAFDAALWDAGIANYNLIKLSSVIPPKSKLETDNPKSNDKSIGNRLYVVLSEKREKEADREAWAGIGWVQAKDGSGMFVEHHGSGQAEVVRLIKNSLTDMVKYRKTKYGEIQYQVVGKRCEGKPVCAIVAAVYEEQDWQSK